MTKSHRPIEEVVKIEERVVTEYIHGVGLVKVTRRFKVVNADDWIEDMTVNENHYYEQNSKKYELLLSRER